MPHPDEYLTSSSRVKGQHDEHFSHSGEAPVRSRRRRPAGPRRSAGLRAHLDRAARAGRPSSRWPASSISTAPRRSSMRSQRPPSPTPHRGGLARVVVDLRAVTFLDSSTLALLLAANGRQQARGGELLILVGPHTPMTPFEVTGFDRLLTIQARAAPESGMTATPSSGESPSGQAGAGASAQRADPAPRRSRQATPRQT